MNNPLNMQIFICLRRFLYPNIAINDRTPARAMIIATGHVSMVAVVDVSLAVSIIESA